MGQGPSQQQISNMALGLCSVSQISDINENSPAAITCLLYWNQAVRDVLRGAPWRFAMACGQSLAQSAVYSNPNYLYSYAYPTNAVKVWKIYGQQYTLGPSTATQPGGSAPPLNYPQQMLSAKFEVVYDPVSNTQYVCTNVVNALCDYTVPLMDPSQYDSQFVMALTYVLGALICVPLINDNIKAQGLMTVANQKLSEAARLNQEENTNQKNAETSSFITARGGGGPVDPRFFNGYSTSSIPNG